MSILLFSELISVQIIECEIGCRWEEKIIRKKKKLDFISVGCVFIIFACVGALIYCYWPEIENYTLNKSISARNDERKYDWDYLKSINPDIIGWLWIPDTVVDYPVVQTSNNDTYLYVGFNGSYNKYGTLFLDCHFTYGADPKMQNSVIYGHSNTTSERQMFAGLYHYMDQSYFEEHPIVYYTRIEDGDTPVPYEVTDVIKVAASYDYRRSQFSDQEQFLQYYSAIRSQSLINSNKNICENDEILTLSTCVFDIPDGRLAVIARRVGQTVEQTEEVQTVQ